MDGFLRHFRREDAGVWSCIDPVELRLPSGRIQVAVGARFRRGTTYMGIDLARLLDEQDTRSGRPASDSG